MNKLKYGNTYVCQRLRLLEYLKDKGFTSWTTVPDLRNPKYSVWITKNSVELEKAVAEYFDSKKH